MYLNINALKKIGGIIKAEVNISNILQNYKALSKGGIIEVDR